MLNPFSAKSKYEQIARSSIFKFEYLSADGNKFRSAENLYVSATAKVMRKKSKKWLSPILTEQDVKQISENLNYFVKFGTLMVWSFIPIPLSVFAMPITDLMPQHENMFYYLMAPFVATAVVLWGVSLFNLLKFRKEQEKIAQRLWARGGIVEIPKSLRRAQTIQNLKIWRGEILASVIDEAIPLIPSDEIQIGAEILTIGSDVIDLVRSNKSQG